MLTVLSVVLYFIFFSAMNMEFYGSEFLLGTYSHGMDNYITYFGMMMIVVVCYICEKFTVLVTGKLYALKYNKELLAKHQTHRVSNELNKPLLLDSSKQTGVTTVNYSGSSSDEKE